MYAHRDQRADVNRKWDAVVAAGHDVADGITAEHCYTPLVEPWQAAGVKAGETYAHRVPSAFHLAHRGAAGANQQHVAFFDVDLLRFLGGIEILGQDFLPRLHPLDFFQPWNIEQYAAAHDTGASDVDCALLCAMRT